MAFATGKDLGEASEGAGVGEAWNLTFVELDRLYGKLLLHVGRRDGSDRGGDREAGGRDGDERGESHGCGCWFVLRWYSLLKGTFGI